MVQEQSHEESADAAINILLVDDEPRNLDVLETLLQSPDYNLVRAQSGQAALMRLLNDDFAAIVLDINMPGMSGLELANLVKQRRRTQHIPIIFLTAYFQEDRSILEGYETGAVDYLTKPINSQILQSKIAVFADLFRKTRALTRSNEALELQIGQRLKAEEALRRGNAELEERIHERTADLVRINEELRSRETALRASEAQALAASRAKDDFLAALSHELRTPLNPVLLLASAAANDPSLPSGVRADFDMIRKNVELEARLIDDMLDLTRITRGKLLLDFRAVDVHEILRDALAIIRAELDAKRIDLRLEFLATKTVVWGDPVRLQQVFWNVLKNAMKFTPDGGIVVLRTRTQADGESLAVEVTDNGIGIETGDLAKVFGAFTQGTHVAGGASHRFGGLGLGLAISRTLVELHDGTIEASSPGRDQGATFLILLPLSSAAAKPAASRIPFPAAREIAAPPPARSVSPAIPSGRRFRILLVDDHAPTRTTLTHLLARRDYDVFSAGSAAEARSIAADYHLDLVVSDIGLPDQDGCELMKGLRAESPELPGIALSGYGMDDDVARTRDAGFREHLKKPVNIDALAAAISSVVRSGTGGGVNPTIRPKK